MSFLFCQRYLSPRSHFANLLGCQNHFQRGRLPVKEKHFRYNVFCTPKTTRFRLAEGDARGTRSVPLQAYLAQPRRWGCRGISSHAQLGGKGCPWASFAVRNQQRSNRQSVLVARLRRLRWFFPRHWKICRRQINLVNNNLPSLRFFPNTSCQSPKFVL